MKSNFEIAEIMKGVAHSRRIRILLAIKSAKSHPSLDELSDASDIPYKTTYSHVERLVESGLVSKSRYGLRVEHRLTEQGERLVEFISCL